MFQLTKKLKHLMQKKDTWCTFVVPIGICVDCSLYKLVHGIEYLHCSELFAIGKSLVHLVL